MARFAVLVWVILEYGEVQKLGDTHWYMAELSSEKTVETTVRRLAKSLATIFGNDPVEVFIPVFRRDLDVFEMKSAAYIFVRSPNLKALMRLKTVTGIIAIVTDGETNRASRAIKVENSYVQSVIADTEQAFLSLSAGIEVGSFVRVLNTDARDLCGTVEAIGDGGAIVRIKMKTRNVLLQCPIRNLLNLSHVPADRRVYYYGPLVEELVTDHGAEGLAMLEDDLKAFEPTPVPESAAPSDWKRNPRSNTVTGLVKRLINVEHVHEPMAICQRVVEALKAGDIKLPKNCFIIYCIVKDALMKNYFRLIDPAMMNYREVVKKYGKAYKFSPQMIAGIDPALGLPTLSNVAEPVPKGAKRRGRPRLKPIPEPRPKKKRGTAALTPEHKAKLHAGLAAYHAAKRSA